MEIIISAAILLIGLGVGFYLLLKEIKDQKDKPADNSMLLLQNQLNEMNRIMDSKLGESTKAIQMQFGETAKIVQNVTERLTKLDETNRQVINFTDQLQSLQDILKNPKQRGILGEYYLETLLKNVLPPGSFEMQYRLGKDDDGSELIPDAVVRVKDKIIPIDAKFSLENYNRLVEEKNEVEKAKLEKTFLNDLKKRITETSKYIRPEKGTMEFAFMFIPHEAIYYDLIINKIGALNEETENLIQRAASKYKVIIVSPTSFLAYLQTVLQGLNAMKIEESAKDIRNNVIKLGQHIAAYKEYMRKLGDNIGTTANAFERADKELNKIDKDVLKISVQKAVIEPIILQAPEDNED